MKNTFVLTTVLIVLFLFLTVNHALAGPAEEKEKFAVENSGTLSGRAVLEDGTPMPYGFVAFFEQVGDSMEHQDYGVGSKRSPMMVAFVKEDGKFVSQLFPAGLYFMGAVMEKGWIGGAPKKGQKKYSAIDSEGNYLLFEVKAAETVDIGTVIVREPVAFPELKTHFTIEGKVLDAQGRGVPDSVVVAKRDLNDPKGIFISAETDAEGNYQLKISPGMFFFVARKSLTRGGRPKPGGLMGTLGHSKPIGLGGKSEEPPAYIIGRNGETFRNVDITMFEVPIPELRRQEVEAKVKAQKLDKSSLPEDLPLMKPKAEEGVKSQYMPEGEPAMPAK